VIVASQPVYSETRFARAFFRSQINSTPSGDVRRNHPFANSFRFRSYAKRPTLHYFGANKSFRFCSYRHPARNPFIIRSYKITGGWHPLPSPDLHEPQVTSNRSHPSRGPLPPIFTGHESQIMGHAAPDLHNFGAPITTFRINTYISVASKRLYLPLESTLMKKGGGGGAPLHRQHQWC
jgi:hypothetical protein